MKRRDIELLSAYLDGELKLSESNGLETRLKTDPELASVLNELRATRTLLRKLPTRKAPRNFALTRKMVGQNPPLPRSYPIFRFATTVATLLFFFTFGLNFVGSQLAAQPQTFGIGGGGGSGEVELYAESAPALEESAAPAPLAPAPAEPGVGSDETGAEEPSVSLAPQMTEVPPTEDSLRIVETPSTKNGETENAIEGEPAQMVEEIPPFVPYGWQIGLAVLALIGTLFMGVMRQLSSRRWK